MANSEAKSTGGFPRSFYIANVMEIFERIAWYGFFTVSSLYMTSSTQSGGLGLSDPQRGVLQGLIPFFVYLLPVFTGALGDRIGYKRMFTIAFLLLTPAYYMLGQVEGFWPFFAFYLLVALGAAIFKPLVVGTVARSANDSNRGIAFGIFYLMVNIGGFIGPVFAGYARAISWDMVFYLSSGAIAINLVLVTVLFDDKAVRATGGKTLDAFKDVQNVLGNGRFALLVAPLLLALMLAGGSWISYAQFAIFSLAWLVVHAVWNLLAKSDAKAWYRQPIRIGNAPFLIYLLVLSLFWAAYNQIFLTFPLYLRDYVDTSDIVALAGSISPGLAGFLAPVNEASLAAYLDTGLATASLSDLVQFQIRPSEDAITAAQTALAGGTLDTAALARDWISQYRQVSPEYIIAFDFLSIVLFQYMVSRRVENRPPFGILVTGSILIAIAYAIGGNIHALPMAGMMAIGTVIVFAFGEMLASPKSQEYVAAIAPKSQAAMFMGYYFVSMALGFLFAGLISGWAYELFARQMNQPLFLWLVFAALAGLAALALMVFNRTLAGQMKIDVPAKDTGS